MSTMGLALRTIEEGPVEVLTRVTDFNLQLLKGPNGEAVEYPANTLVAFKAVAFREIRAEDSTDVWEFRTVEDTEAGPVNMLLYLRGEDIFLVRAVSKVAT